MNARTAAGFTLLEILFVVLVSSVVLAFAANFYVDLSAASTAALDSTVEIRRATSVLDRVARDLEGATLVIKPEEIDPLEHPWLFFAESRSREGAERLRFQARNHRPRAAVGHESDLVDLAYWLAPSETVPGSFDLLRWASAQPPQAPLDRNFPRPGDPGVEVLASGVALFSVRLQDAEGAWQSAWDSWSPAQSSALPLAAELRLALAPVAETEEEAFEAGEPLVYARPVLFALDPLDLEKALTGEEGEGEGEEEDEDLACVTVSQCVSRNQALADAYLEQHPEAREILASIGDQCVKDAQIPFTVENCE